MELKSNLPRPKDTIDVRNGSQMKQFVSKRAKIRLVQSIAIELHLS